MHHHHRLRPSDWAKFGRMTADDHSHDLGSGAWVETADLPLLHDAFGGVGDLGPPCMLPCNTVNATTPTRG